MSESTEKPKAVHGQEAERINREALGIGDRRKHHVRAATPLRAHVAQPGTHHRPHRFRFHPTEEQAEQLHWSKVKSAVLCLFESFREVHTP
ncbi:hypothetical protein [Streptomyces sp. NPDC006739]|uniref:hypothetical protein n=1 Tax=Streptomyces sp. NPDC006739 TaxID=3364763 RepID=UPI00368273D8